MSLSLFMISSAQRKVFSMICTANLEASKHNNYIVEMKKPLVSVIVPVYNGAQFIGEAIESVFVQNYDPLEIIIVDDGSTDETANIVKSYNNMHYIYQPNQGVAAARNSGIENSMGKLIAFLDADDCWAPNKLNIQVDCLLKHPHIGYTLGRQKNFLEPRDREAILVKGGTFTERSCRFFTNIIDSQRYI